MSGHLRKAIRPLPPGPQGTARLRHRPRQALQARLGHLLNPIDPTSDDRSWIRQFWEVLVAEALHLSTPDLDWLDRPAIGRFTLSAPAQLTVFRNYNTDLAYGQQVKPYNFLITAIPRHFATDTDARPVRLVAPYETDPTTWPTADWRNLHNPDAAPVQIEIPRSDTAHGPETAAVAVKTYRTVLGDYRTRLEAKSLTPVGRLCRPGTTGLLQIRPVTARPTPIRIGKEADRIDLMEADLITAEEAVTKYMLSADPLDVSLYSLGHLSNRQLAKLVGVDPSTIRRLRKGSRPRAALRAALLSLARCPP